ncbi:MAG: DNA primase [Balneolaceae bacterium]|nr:DNA primase [Balneolaceae bacterium]
MIPDDKKEEVREASDLVEVVGDYVKLKRSGRSWKGLCPFHDEKTASFHVTPDMGIYKCFGCGESGDVFNFVMEMEGVGFTEALRTLADRYGVSLPKQEEPEHDEEHHLREGIYHALRFAGVYYYRQLLESEEAEQARQYLHQRGYNRQIMKTYGLGYAPAGGDSLLESARGSNINEEYLREAGLIKPSKRGEGFYDTFRGRLMFPIFNPSGKVIAFAGRVLGNQKAAKYINSPQTRVYNKSEVLYGVNFARNEIRKTGEVLLVEGYTDVISLQQHGVIPVVASSGTSLTPQQVKLLHRYGEAITMIYDSDSAGVAAMKRGINIALSEGLDVKLLELPEGEDPDSFVRQFGEEAFHELKKEGAEDFVSYLVHKAQAEGKWEDPSAKKKVISEALRSIAHMPDPVGRETFVQHLNKLVKVGDRALFEELGKVRQELAEQEARARRREKMRARRESSAPDTGSELPDRHTRAFEERRSSAPPREGRPAPPPRRPNYEKTLIRLMLSEGREMVAYIGSYCNEKQFQDEELRAFYDDIIERYKEEEEISVEAYSNREQPYPKLLGEVVMERHSISERHHEKTGVKIDPNRHPYRVAKSTLRLFHLDFFVRSINELTDKLADEEVEDRQAVLNTKMELQNKRTFYMRSHPDELFEDPDSDAVKASSDKVFEYKMKHEREE